jgi:site-specific recombinase XerD
LAIRPAAPSYPASSSPRRRTPALHLPLDAALESYGRQLRAENKSDQTIDRLYLPRLRSFVAWLGQQGMPSSLEGVTREHVEAYVLWLQQKAPGRKRTEGQMPASVSIAYRTLRSFFNWAVREDLLPRSPMDKMRAPSVPEEPPAVLRDADLERLIKVCKGTGFESRRDMALIRLLYDTGMRRGEIASLRVEDIDWSSKQIYVHAASSKSKVGRMAPFGAKAGMALDHYLRERSRHLSGEAPWLWLGKRGRLSDSGILQVVERRGKDAGFDKLHPHMFRHAFAHNMKASGLSDEMVMMLGGWRDPGSMQRYGKGAAAERAIAHYRHVAPGDRVG